MMFVTVSMCSIMHAVIHRKVLFNCCCFTIQKVSSHSHAGKQLDTFGELQLVVRMKRKDTPTDVDRWMYG